MAHHLPAELDADPDVVLPPTREVVSLMKVVLRNPHREITVDGRRRVHALLAELQLSRESHLVIRNGTLVPGDAELDVDDVIEIRPVISGGA